jgi:AraC-like DNA-binding protein
MIDCDIVVAEIESESADQGDPIPPAFFLADYYVSNFFGEAQALELTERAGLQESPGILPSLVTIVDFWKLCLDNITLVDDEGQGCTAQRLPLSTWGMVFSAMNEMDTVGDGLKRFASLTPLIPAGVDVMISHAPDRVMINFRMAQGAYERGDRYLEIVALVTHCILCWGTGSRIDPVHIRLSTLLDDRHGSLLVGLAANVERYGEGVTLAYDKAVLDRPLGVRRYQSPQLPETEIFLEIAAQMASGSAGRRSEIVETVKAMLLREPLSQQQAADRMRISVATLQRRLARAGTTFRLLSQDVRRDKLLSLLRTAMNLDDIAENLGFSDRRSLWRACQQWFGMSPTEFRNNRN